MTTNRADYDRVFRTDRGKEYYYSPVAASWLSMQTYSVDTNALALAATTNQVGLWPVHGGIDLWLVSLEVNWAVAGGGTALDASNRWAMLLKSVDGGTGTSLVTTQINSGTSDATWNTSASTAIGALMGTSVDLLTLDAVKFGTPGNLSVAARLLYREVG